MSCCNNQGYYYTENGNKVFVVKSTSITSSGTVTTITVPNTTVAISNCDQIRLCIAQDIPSSNPANTVSLSINGVTIPIWTKYHNNVRTDQLKKCKCYYLGVGTEVPSLTILNCIPKSGYVYSTIPVPTTTITTTA